MVPNAFATVVSTAEVWAPIDAWPGAPALRAGDRFRVDASGDAFCQLGDPCWEGIAARGIGCAAAARDEIDKALEWLMEARTRCVRLPDAWLWIEAYTLDALCSLAVEPRSRPRGCLPPRSRSAGASCPGKATTRRVHQFGVGRGGTFTPPTEPIPQSA